MQGMRGGDNQDQHCHEKEMEEKAGTGRDGDEDVGKPKPRVTMNMLLMIFHAIKLAHKNHPSLNRMLILLLLATTCQEVLFWQFGLFAATIHKICRDGVGPEVDPQLQVFFTEFAIGFVLVGAVPHLAAFIFYMDVCV